MSSEVLDAERCPICRDKFEDGDDVVEIRHKGAAGINTASIQRGEGLKVAAGQNVHANCRKWYANQKRINDLVKTSSPSKIVKRSVRASTGPFDSKADCLFCGMSILHSNLSRRSDYSCVKTESFSKSVLECCTTRCDDWSFIVKGRIECYFGDLHAAHCLYHHSCNVNFRYGGDIPLQFQGGPDVKRKRLGRPKNDDQEKAFSKLCSYLKINDEEQLTVSHLNNKMKEFLNEGESHTYGNQYLKSKLKERYGDSIFFVEEEGHEDIVTMRENASKILRSYFKHKIQEGDKESQKRAIIETAARLIKSDIKANIPSITKWYPSAQDLNLDSAKAYIPESLHTLLSLLFVGKDTRRKVASIGQAVVQAVRPRAVLAPLQIGLAIQMHHLYRSRFIVDSLHEMEFSSSYDEVLRFEKNAANCAAPEMLGGETDPTKTMLLSFHGMGMIAAITPGRQTNCIIPRQNISDLNILERTKIDIKEYRFASYAHRNIQFRKLPALCECDKRIDVLWELFFNFKQQTSNWQGMMHIVHKGMEHPGKSSVVFLPMIDIYPSDKTCIYSTLEYVTMLAKHHNVFPVITFDQPLYWKAAEIICDAPCESHLKSIVLMLGSFHTFMNLLGAIGTLMEGSGLTSILQEVYGESAVVHMMTGKSVQRAFRGHLLVDECLSHMIVKGIINDNPEFASLVNQCEEMYSSLLKGRKTLQSVISSEVISKVTKKINDRETELQTRSRTSKLWINYRKMLQTARSLLKADRTGSWSMHLRAVSDCLPIFAAAGHYNYLRSAYYYIQDLSKLENTHPDIFEKFQEGFHVIHRSNQFWAGLGSDLVIKQTLMRSLKGPGGLTRGSRMSEQHRSLWTMSSPSLSEYNYAMQDFTELAYTTSEQHKECTESRMKRDLSDLSVISSKLIVCNPFSNDPTLGNIVNGVVAEDNVNVYDLFSVGNRVVKNMIGLPSFTFSFKRKDKVKTMGNMSAVKVAPEKTIDPALLFQRFLIVSQSGELSLEETMKYELSPFPPALFEAKNLFRKADKPQLAQALIDHCKSISSKAVKDIIPKTSHYVLDGGSLLHRLTWKRGDSYGTIVQSYADFTIHRYGLATVVFDGYNKGPSIKDNTHQRRGQNIHPVISFTAETEFLGKREDFLSRDSNKQGLINLIGDELRRRGCKVVHAPGDADVQIVMAAVESSHLHSTTLIGEDTDLLVLLLYHSTTGNKGLYFRSDNQTRLPKMYDINCLKLTLGDKICSQLLFLHAFTGCDTTSRIFGVGKKSAFQKLLKGDFMMNSYADAFLQPMQTSTTIEDYGNKTMILMFGGKKTDTLESLRYTLLSRKVVSAKSFVTPARLPPTASATRFHSLRVYYQIMVWIDMGGNMDPISWGWKLEENQLVPVMNQMSAAPEKLLKMIHCCCSASCSTTRCSCRRYGLACTAACGSCQVISCENPNNQVTDSHEWEEL